MNTPVIPFSSLPIPTALMEAAIDATCVPRLDITAMGSAMGLVWNMPPEGTCRDSGVGATSCESLRSISTISWNRPGTPVGTPPEVYLPDTVNPAIKGFLASSIRASTGGAVGSPMIMSGTSMLSLVDENNAPLRYIKWSLASANRCPLSTPLLDNAPLVQIGNNEQIITYSDSTPAGRCSNAAVSGRTISRCSSTGVPDFLVGNVLLDNFTNSYDSCSNACEVGTSPGVGSLGSDGRYYLSAGSSATFYPEFAPNCATAGGVRACTGFNSADGTVDTLGSLTGSATLSRTNIGSCTSRCPAAAAISWNAGGNTCTFTTAAAAEHGFSTGIASTNANTGAATLSCDRDLGWQVSGGTCTPPYIWTYNRWLGYTYADSAHELVEDATTNSPCSSVGAPAGPYDPAILAVYDCSGGCAVLNSTRTTSVGASCYRGGTIITNLRSNAECICTNAPAGNCAAGSRSWGAGCSANFPLTSAGGVTAVTNNTAAGHTGSAAFRCDAGVWSGSPQVGSTCDVIPSGVACTTFNSVVQPPIDPFANGNNGGTLITLPSTGNYTISVNYQAVWDDAAYLEGNSCKIGTARVSRVSDGAILDQVSFGGAGFVAAEPECQTAANSILRTGTLSWTSNANEQVRIYLSWNYGSAAPAVSASWGWGKVTTSGATCPAAPACGWQWEQTGGGLGNVPNSSNLCTGPLGGYGDATPEATSVCNATTNNGTIITCGDTGAAWSTYRCRDTCAATPMCWSLDDAYLGFADKNACDASNVGSCAVLDATKSGGKCARVSDGVFDYPAGGFNGPIHSFCRPVSEGGCNQTTTTACADLVPGSTYTWGPGNNCSATLPILSFLGDNVNPAGRTTTLTNTTAGYTGTIGVACYDSDPVVGNSAREAFPGTSGSGIGGTCTSNSAVNCVGSWSSDTCASQNKRYVITTPASGGGTPCPYANNATPPAGVCSIINSLPTCGQINGNGAQFAYSSGGKTCYSACENIGGSQPYLCIDNATQILSSEGNISCGLATPGCESGGSLLLQWSDGTYQYE